jgi:hypothetical protein
MDAAHDKLIYIFCLTGEAPSRIDIRLPHEISVIEVDGLYFIIKYVSDKDFGENNLKKNISDVVWLDRKVREHLDVITCIMQTLGVIPFNFGTLYKSEISLRQFATKYADVFKKNLYYLEGKEEWAVKSYCSKKKIVENISLLSKNISDIDALIQTASPGKAYILGKKKKDIIENEIISIYNLFSKNIFTRFNDFAEEYRLNPIPSFEITERGDDMILNAVFLIKKEVVASFVKLSDQLPLQHDNIGLILELTGPWPSYSFVKI